MQVFRCRSISITDIFSILPPSHILPHILGSSHRYIQGVPVKLCFFTIQCNPSLAYIAVRDLQSSQRNASVLSLQLAGYFLYNQ